MPEFYRLSNSKAKICLHADDHAPPHVHLRFPGGSALIDIRTLAVIRGDAPANVLREACEWLAGNRDAAFEEWRRLNERE